MDGKPGASALFAPDVLSGRTALITGGGSGIGYGIAECLAAAGASVGIFSRNEERVTQAAERLASSHGVRTLPTVGDVREPAALERAVRETRDALGSIDILVNNAAGNFYAPTADLSPNGWRAVVEIDLFGTFHACRAVYPVMVEQGYGRIVSISMTLYYRGWPLMAHATAAKAGVDALTRTLAIEWARDGINVNSIAPGPIPTEGVKKAFEAPPSEEVDMFGARSGAGFAERFIPAGRLGHPHDIGQMITFLCSPGGDWITGAVLVVDGGESLVSPRTIPPGRSES
ncbi:SDR family oxidoreductase [Candidatus Palauibacter sp.]|uniref:SDR family oxidoreductase n=1 Tax=Candidatus Palauibacter sp. TaxID=3101350 RepID=UPI003B51EEDC